MPLAKDAHAAEIPVVGLDSLVGNLGECSPVKALPQHGEDGGGDQDEKKGFDSLHANNSCARRSRAVTWTP
jgi:hypothetical protein